MVIVEKCVPELTREIQALETLITGPNGRMFVLGAIHAIQWIRDGIPPPSESHILNGRSVNYGTPDS